MQYVRRRRYSGIPSHLAGNAVNEQSLGELPEDLMSERLMRDPTLSPRLVQVAPGVMPTFAPPNPLVADGPSYKSSIVPFLAQTVSAKALPANANRAFLLIQNNQGGGNAIRVNFGADANPGNSIIVIDGGNLVFTGGGRGGSFCPQEDVYISGVVANSACVVMEGLVYS